MFYRVKQFILALISKLSEDDIRFINLYLDSEEKELFNRLSESEQKHSVNVARDMKEIFHNNKMLNDIVKVSLLHDIGKIAERLNIIDKSILVILDKITRGSLKKYCKNSKVNIYYNHGEVGSNLLRGIKYDKELLNIIKYHHYIGKHVLYNDILNKLQEVDNKY